MAFKLNIGEKGKSYKVESNSESFVGKKLGDIVKGSDIKEVSDFNDYEFKITGASDKQGFPVLNFEGVGLKRVLLGYGPGMHKRPKGLKKKKPNKKPDGLRLRKTVHANNIDSSIIQINMKVSKQGAKPLAEIFKKPEAEKPAEQPAA